MKWDRTKGRPEPIRLLNLVSEIESGEPLVDIRDVAPRVRIPRPQTIPYCRKSVAEMVARANDMLPPGVTIAITDAWRPFRRQQMIYDFMWKCAQEAFPHLDFAGLRRKVNRWVAPVDQKAPPGHCTGAALDILLVDSEGNDIDIVSPFDRFSGAPTYIYGLTPEAHRNRFLMVDAMLAAGFSNCRDEHWHYSFGDAGWAVRLGLDTCQYGLIELPLETYAENQREWEAAFVGRPNPFLELPK
ncbi:MAG: D-alanyl-D-alanine carboxypeptidase family protein [Armatimonadetes bacterium]|nr:D-alanyl-D-alanine carboxypeptidase family protein [Armatimonadota bacterium]